MIEGPGTRILAGSYHALTSRGDLLLARRTGAPEGSLTLIDPQRERSCELEGAARFVYPSIGWIAHTSATDASSQGEIHFATPECDPLPSVVAGASLPFDVTHDHEAVLLVGDELRAIDPITGADRVIASAYAGADRLFLPGQQVYVWLVASQGELILFDARWRELSRFGEDVREVATISSPGAALVQDGNALHLLRITAESSLLDTVLTQDGCRPYAADREHFTYLSPCSERRLHSLDASNGDVDFGPLDVDPKYTLPVSLGSASAQNRTLRLFMLREVDTTIGLGELWALDVPRDATSSSNDGAAGAPGSDAEAIPHKIANAADLAWLHSTPRRDGTYALVDVEAGVGRVVYVPRAGEAETIVDAVPRTARNLFYYRRDYWFFAHAAPGRDAHLVRICKLAGCSPAVAAAELPTETIAERVPELGFASAVSSEDFALLHDAEAGLGTLSIQDGPVVAGGVPAGGFVGLYPIMNRGVAYLTRFDVERRTGALEYWNQSLDARGLVAENVAEFLRADWPYMGLIYLVPNGDNAGLWYARGK